MKEELENAVTYVRSLIDGNEEALDSFAAGPVDDVAVHLGEENYGDYDPLEILKEALEQSDLDPEAAEAVMAAATASATATATATATADGGGYSIEQLATIFAEGIKVEVNNTEFTNEVDNSLYVDGDVKGGIYQENQTNIVNADDGAIAAGRDQDGQFQTVTGDGDALQADDTHGVVNQGDNSGQIAGRDADADNIQSGDYNTAASDYAVLGDENVQAHDIKDSEFGDGDKTDDDSINIDATIKESFNQTDNSTDDDYTSATAKVHVDEGGYGHEEPEYKHEEPAYEKVEEVHYDEPEHEPEPEYLDD